MFNNVVWYVIVLEFKTPNTTAFVISKKQHEQCIELLKTVEAATEKSP